jgi:DNA-binding transcriptional ArsR family regulator
MDPAQADRIFHALADATRRDIVTRVMQREHNVSTLTGFYAMSFAAVQKHVALLERAQLVVKQRRGREQLVRGNPGTIRRARQLLDQFEAIWAARVGRLDRLLDEPRQGDATCPSDPSPRTRRRSR